MCATCAGRDRPSVTPGPRGRVAIKSKKNPLDAWEIEGRAFAAQMLPAGQSASGFFYFQTELQPGVDRLYQRDEGGGDGEGTVLFRDSAAMSASRKPACGAIRPVFCHNNFQKFIVDGISMISRQILSAFHF